MPSDVSIHWGPDGSAPFTVGDLCAALASVDPSAVIVYRDRDGDWVEVEGMRQDTLRVRRVLPPAAEVGRYSPSWHEAEELVVVLT